MNEMLEAEQWRARAEKAEKELAELRTIVFTNGDRSMTLKGRTFIVDDNGGFIYDQNFDFDASMKVSGDFLDGEKKQYAEMIAEALNKAASNNIIIELARVENYRLIPSKQIAPYGLPLRVFFP